MTATVKILDTNEIKDILISRLRDGWAFIEGNADIITHIENEYYKPGTDKNKMFEMIYGNTDAPGKLMYFIKLGKKECLPSTFQDVNTRFIYFEELEGKLVCLQLCSRDSGIPIFCKRFLRSLGVV